jgi:hypothetical protein
MQGSMCAAIVHSLRVLQSCGAADRKFPTRSTRRTPNMLKLPTHNRYEYSRIEKRRDFSWPEGKRLAFYIALNVEDFAFMAGRGNDPYLRSNSPQTQRNYAWRDYGLRVGIWRIFRALDELKMPATACYTKYLSMTVTR